MSNAIDLIAEGMKPIAIREKGRAWACAIILFFCTNGGCATISDRRHSSKPLIRIAYSPGGDAPVVTLMYIYEEYLRFGEFGGHLSRKRVSRSALAKIRTELAAGILSHLRTSPGVGRHERELWIKSGELEIGFLLEDIPRELVPLLKDVKALFGREFGERFGYVYELFP